MAKKRPKVMPMKVSEINDYLLMHYSMPGTFIFTRTGSSKKLKPTEEIDVNVSDDFFPLTHADTRVQGMLDEASVWLHSGGEDTVRLNYKGPGKLTKKKLTNGRTKLTTVRKVADAENRRQRGWELEERISEAAKKPVAVLLRELRKEARNRPGGGFVKHKVGDKVIKFPDPELERDDVLATVVLKALADQIGMDAVLEAVDQL